MLPFRTASIVLVACLMIGCQQSGPKAKKARDAGTMSAVGGDSRAMRESLQRTHPDARIGVVTAVMQTPRRILAFGDVPVAEFQKGDTITIVDPTAPQDQQVVAMGTVARTVGSSVHAWYEQPQGREPQAGDLAIRFEAQSAPVRSTPEVTPTPSETPTEPAPTEGTEAAPTEGMVPAPTEATEPAAAEVTEPASAEAMEPAPTEATEPAPAEATEPAPGDATEAAPADDAGTMESGAAAPDETTPDAPAADDTAAETPAADEPAADPLADDATPTTAPAEPAAIDAAEMPAAPADDAAVTEDDAAATPDEAAPSETETPTTAPSGTEEPALDEAGDDMNK